MHCLCACGAAARFVRRTPCRRASAERPQGRKKKCGAFQASVATELSSLTRKEAHTACTSKPGKPCHAHGLGPKCKRVGPLKTASEGLKRGSCLEPQRDPLAATAGSAAVSDFDVESGEACRC